MLHLDHSKDTQNASVCTLKHVNLCEVPCDYFKVTLLNMRVGSGMCYLAYVRVASVYSTERNQEIYGAPASQDTSLLVSIPAHPHTYSSPSS